MNIIFHEILKAEKNSIISSAKMLFSVIENRGYVPKKGDEIVFNEESYKIVRISNIYEYCHFNKSQKLQHIDIFVIKL